MTGISISVDSPIQPDTPVWDVWLSATFKKPYPESSLRLCLRLRFCFASGAKRVNKLPGAQWAKLRGRLIKA